MGPNICRNKLCLSGDVVPIKSTWSFNLLSAELRALNINVRLIIQKKLAATEAGVARELKEIAEEGNEEEEEEEEGEGEEEEMYDHALDDPEAMAKELELQLRLIEDAADISGKL